MQSGGRSAQARQHGTGGASSRSRASVGRVPGDRRAGPRCGRERRGRAPRQDADHHAGLFPRSRSDTRSIRGWLVQDRRHRETGCRRLFLLRLTQERHHPATWREHRRSRARSGDRHASCRARVRSRAGGGGARRGRDPRRGGAEARRARNGAGDRTMVPRAPRASEGASLRAVRGRASAHADAQGGEGFAQERRARCGSAQSIFRNRDVLSRRRAPEAGKALPGSAGRLPVEQPPLFRGVTIDCKRTGADNPWL